MEKNQALILASAVFGIIALVHLARAIMGLDAIIAGFNVPIYASYVFFVVAGLLAWLMYGAGKK